MKNLILSFVAAASLALAGCASHHHADMAECCEHAHAAGKMCAEPCCQQAMAADKACTMCMDAHCGEEACSSSAHCETMKSEACASEGACCKEGAMAGKECCKNDANSKACASQCEAKN